MENAASDDTNFLFFLHVAIVLILRLTSSGLDQSSGRDVKYNRRFRTKLCSDPPVFDRA